MIGDRSALLDGPAYAAMRQHRQFLAVRFVPSATRPGKFDKIPVHWQTGAAASAHDPANWTDAATACAAADRLGGTDHGIGFAFTPNDPFFFLDVDECRDGDAWSPIANEMCRALPGALVEVSQSHRGLHLIARGTVPPHSSRRAEAQRLGIEFYTAGRFVALTGHSATGSADADLTPHVGAIVARYFPPAEVNAAPADAGPVPEWRGPTDDAELIRRALESKSAGSIFGGRASFADLWQCNAEALARAFPSASGDAFDRSSADAALAQHLSFWTGKDAARIDRLMRQSALVREKWERDDYLPRTISTAVGQGGVLQMTAPSAPIAPPAGPLSRIDIGAAFDMPLPPQVWHWDGYMPAGEVTLLSGHGGAGKSQLALGLAVSIAGNVPYLRVNVRQGNVLFYSAEDPARTLKLRLRKTAHALGVDKAALAQRLHLIDATEGSPALYVAPQRGEGATTSAYDRLREYIAANAIDVAIIDNASDAFDGDEINRAQVRAFMRSLALLVRERDGAVLLLSHVDKATSRAGKTAGSEAYSGSTAWHNSARSRLFLQADDDANTLTLQHQKSNLGPKCPPITLAWPMGGIPARLDDLAPVGTGGAAPGDAAMRAVLLLLVEYAGRGEFAATAPNSPARPFALLRGQPTFPKHLKNQEVQDLMRDAQRRGLVEAEAYRDGSRNQRERWRVTAAGADFASAISVPTAASVGCVESAGA